MSIFGSFMPGESSGMPTQGLGGLLGGGKMDLGLLGLSLLANNNSKNFGQNLGRAGISAIGMQQRMQQQQAMNDWRKQQQEWRQRQMDMQDADRAREVANRQKQQQALDDLVKNNPNIDPLLLKVDPNLALKQAYPNPQQDNSYYQAISTPNGLAKFNARSGELELIQGPNGQPIMKSSDSIPLQGSLSESKARGAAGYKMYDGIEGLRTTVRQAAEMAGGGRTMQPQSQANNTDYPYQVSPQVQAERDQVRLSLLNEELAQATDPNHRAALAKEIQQSGGNVGIKVPTKAEQAAVIEMAKLNAKNKAETEGRLPQVEAEATEAVRLIDELLTHPGFEGAVGLSSYNPLNRLAGSDENDFNIRLDQIKGKQFLQAFETLKGGGQITEMEGRKATDAISRMNTSASEQEFKNAAQDFKQVIQSGLNRAKAKVNGAQQIMPSNEQMPRQADAQPMPEKPSKMTLKRGVVYDTPKGALRWNGQTFEDL